MLLRLRAPLRIGLGAGTLLLAWSLPGSAYAPAARAAQESAARPVASPRVQEADREARRRESARAMRDILPVRARIREEVSPTTRKTWNRKSRRRAGDPDLGYLPRILPNEKPGLPRPGLVRGTGAAAAAPRLEIHPSEPFAVAGTEPLALGPPSLENQAWTLRVEAVDFFYQPAGSIAAAAGYAGIRLPLDASTRLGLAFNMTAAFDPERSRKSNGEGLLIFVSLDF